MSPIAVANIGTIIKITMANSAFMVKAIMTAPMSIPGERNIIRSIINTKFCTCVTSLVNLVISDPVLKVSIFENENF